MNQNEKDLGALWERNGAKGKYMTGVITINNIAYPIVCFTNQNMKNPKAPHWRILRSVPKDTTQPKNDLPVRDDAVDELDIPF